MNIPTTTRDLLSKSQATLRKARQRERMRVWILKQTHGKISTAEGYVMEMMRTERQSTERKMK